jgi:uncharacterized iron-regulated membrane protein
VCRNHVSYVHVEGHRWGAIGQAIFAIASLIPLGLYATGLVLWLRKRGRARGASPEARGGLARRQP